MSYSMRYLLPNNWEKRSKELLKRNPTKKLKEKTETEHLGKNNRKKTSNNSLIHWWSERQTFCRKMVLKENFFKIIWVSKPSNQCANGKYNCWIFGPNYSDLRIGYCLYCTLMLCRNFFDLKTLHCCLATRWIRSPQRSLLHWTKHWVKKEKGLIH